jgi:hypothetical protein
MASDLQDADAKQAVASWVQTLGTYFLYAAITSLDNHRIKNASFSMVCMRSLVCTICYTVLSTWRPEQIYLHQSVWYRVF